MVARNCKALTIPATLPGMVSALQFRATINSTLATKSFPSGCGDLPAMASARPPAAQA